MHIRAVKCAVSCQLDRLVIDLRRLALIGTQKDFALRPHSDSDLHMQIIWRLKPNLDPSVSMLFGHVW